MDPLTVDEAARTLSCSRETILRLIRSKKLPAEKVTLNGRRWLIDRERMIETLSVNQAAILPRGNYIYFIQANEGGLIKIGISRDPFQHFASIQAYCPMPLQLLGVIARASLALEERIHSRFKNLRRHGEWFEPATALLDFIAENTNPLAF